MNELRQIISSLIGTQPKISKNIDGNMVYSYSFPIVPLELVVDLDAVILKMPWTRRVILWGVANAPFSDN